MAQRIRSWRDPNVNPRDLDRHLLWQMQYAVDYFDAFWKAEWPPERDRNGGVIGRLRVPRWDPPRPDPALATGDQAPLIDPFPRRPGTTSILKWPFGNDNTSLPEKYTSYRTPFFTNRRTDDGSGYSVEDDMRERLAAIGVEVQRILGAGSQGLAVLVHFNNRQLVVKWGRDFEAMAIEMISMRQLVGARHIVQVCSRLHSSIFGTSVLPRSQSRKCQHADFHALQRKWIPGLSDKGIGTEVYPEDWDLIVSGEDTYEEEIAEWVGINLDDEDDRRLIYAMEFLKHGNLNVSSSSDSDIGAGVKRNA